MHTEVTAGIRLRRIFVQQAHDSIETSYRQLLR